MNKIKFTENPIIQRVAYLGTGMLMIAPRAKQWNLTVLNFSSGTQYLYNYFSCL